MGRHDVYVLTGLIVVCAAQMLMAITGVGSEMVLDPELGVEQKTPARREYAVIALSHNDDGELHRTRLGGSTEPSMSTRLVIHGKMQAVWERTAEGRNRAIEAALDQLVRAFNQPGVDYESAQLWLLTWSDSDQRAPDYRQRLFPRPVAEDEQWRREMVSKYAMMGIFDVGDGKRQRRAWLHEAFSSQALATIWYAKDNRVEAKNDFQRFSEAFVDQWEQERLAGNREGPPLVAAQLWKLEWDRDEYDIDNADDFDYVGTEPSRAKRLFSPR